MSNGPRRITTPNSGGVADSREKRPRGAGQFSMIVETKTSADKAKRASAAPPIKGFTPSDIKELKEAEKRYAASRRAAPASARDNLYD